ncbi:hypothetical protein I6F48_07805 [Pseudoalteromonas sp. SWYJ118]|nr:hypothetical protein [Pseudoalteromonas sp. SWYJ118]
MQSICNIRLYSRTHYSSHFRSCKLIYLLRYK